MCWAEPDVTVDYYPQGACGCGAGLESALDLGVARSFQQLETPEPAAKRIQHDLHAGLCGCGREHLAARPPGVPDSPVSIGPNLRALAVYLVVFQHVPVERCRDLIADVTGAAVSAGFVHSCLRAAADLVAGVIRLIAALITAAHVAGFDETTLRAGPAGQKKYVLGAFTEECSLLFLGTRSLESFRDFGILPDFRGVVVSDRYVNYFHPGWENIAGNQACCSHLLRDFEDCAETYPDAHWPAQAQRAALAGASAAGAARPDPRLARRPRLRPGRDPGRRRGSAGPGVPPRRHRRPVAGPPCPRAEELHRPAPRPRSAGILPQPRGRRAAVHR